MSEIKADPQAEGRYLVVGELSLHTVSELMERGAEIMESEARSLDLDLREVTRTDSAGLALLIEWMRAAHRRHRNIVFRNVPAQMLAIARISGVQNVLHLNS